jgi:hypothetical protein
MKKATTKQSGPHVNCRLSQISIQLPFNQLVNWDFAFGEALGVGNIQQLRSPCTARTGQRSGTASQKRRTLSTAARTDLALGPSECGSGRNSPRRTNELLQLRHVVQLASIAWILASLSTILNNSSSPPGFPLELKRWRFGGK